MRTNTTSILLKLASSFYVLLVFYITFLARRRESSVDYRSKAEFKTLDKFKILRHWNDLPEYSKVSYGQDIFGNILMFIPMIPALYLLLGKELSWGLSILIIIMLSSCIEIGQYVFNRGVFDLDDILLNTTGGILGLAIWKIISKRNK